jgi:predicted O-methyltransferase YrrM
MDDPAWTLLPGALKLLLEGVEAGRKTIVECGSGASTIAIGRQLHEGGAGTLHSLEHDPAWAAHTRARIERERLGAWTTLIEAPLRPHPLAEPDCGWYDAAALAALPAAVDLLLVDGPPGPLAANGETRYPALPLLAPRLAPGALVFLDDIHRAGEQAVLERWERELAIEFELQPRERIAIGVFSGPQEPLQGGNA